MKINEERLDFWNLNINPITMQSAVKDSEYDKQKEKIKQYYLNNKRL